MQRVKTQNRYLLSILIYLVFISPVFVWGPIMAQISDPDPKRFSEEIEAFMLWDSKNSFNENAILFVGSSSIRLWSTAFYFPEFLVINRGFGGSHISDVNHYYEQIVKKYKPARIVFYAGDNDIADGKSPQQVLKDFKHFAGRVEQDFPNTRVYYLPIKPSISRWQFWPLMSETNTMIQQLIQKKANFTYVDTATPMLNAAGEPNPDLFVKDILHLNTRGYQLWSKILLPFLEKN